MTTSTTGVDVDRSLRGQGGHRAVQALLLGPGRSRLGRTLQEMIGTDSKLRSCRLRRSHFKPGRKLSAVYDVVTDDSPEVVPVAVSWFHGGLPDDDSELDAAESTVRTSGIPHHFDRLWTTDPVWHMRVLASPFDPAFPGLARWWDPAHACAELPGAHAWSVRPVRYRPGERHVLEYRAPGQPRVFVKLYRPGQSVRFASAVAEFAAMVDRIDPPGLAVARAAAVWAADDAIVYDEISGAPLSQLLRTGRDIAEPLRQTGVALRAIHGSQPAAGSTLAERTLDAEVRAVHRACEGMNALRPDLGAAAARVVDQAAARLARRPVEWSVVHGDMKADHVMIGPIGLTLIDLDRAARADPALDVGKMLADVRWWSWVSADQNHLAELDLVAGYGRCPGRMARARLYAAILLVKMAARRIPVSGDDWARRTAQVVALARRTLEGTS